ncbi:MAG: 16S rRNA (adenine(1518)-N(6)/adenine(1519)-N(6))-dimethyltransferase RsmA [Gammaproteobacteria bacterium]|nr:16S rRNA (adenine(1518)-N(6)/adenine(1519)-N(6))-dimethyltransferase RsmA [Gammaproteobacteria bacterium]
MPRKRFGQHFLIDDELIDCIHQLISPKPADQVLEIGPGRGALTNGLVASGADVMAVEIDNDLAADLRTRYSAVKVVACDALKVPDEIFRQKRVVGNLPYGISTALLLRLVTISEIIDMHFMLQSEVVDRLVATPGTKDWGRLSVKTQQSWKVHRCLDAEPNAFWPKPQVNSSFVRIEPIVEPKFVKNQIAFDEVLRRAFGQRRKKISNSLEPLNIEWEQTGIDASLRADQLSVEQYVAIANSLNE